MTLRAQPVDPSILDPEVAPPPLWEVDAHLSADAQLSADAKSDFISAVAEVLDVAQVPSAVGITRVDGWPYVTIENLDGFADAFMSVSSTVMFESGGTYTLQSLDEHLRIVHVPTRTTDEAIIEVIRIAQDYPNAEVLLEAPTAGPQYPKLHIARLTSAQVQEVDARLSEPRLATADVDGYALEYVLGSLGTEGVTYVTGTLGAVSP